jgi:hypothetical protein
MNATAEEVRKDHDHNHGHNDACERTVKVHVNNDPVFLHTGRYTVATLKELSKVALAEDLVQLVGTKLEPLPDDGHVHIHGCEIFISHVKAGGAS